MSPEAKRSVKYLAIYFAAMVVLSLIVGAVSAKVRSAAKYNVDKIEVEVTGKRTEYDSYGEAEVVIEFTIKNGTRSETNNIYTEIVIYDNDGNKLATLKSRYMTMGTSYDPYFKQGESVDLTYTFTAYDISDGEAFSKIWNADFEELSFKTRVYEVKFADGYIYEAEE